MEQRDQPMSEYMKQLINRQKHLVEIAKANQDEIDMFHLAKNSGEKHTEFPINSYVTAAYENDEHKPPSKLHPRRRGPFRVISKTQREEGDVYTCQDLITRKNHDFHVKLLHPFIYDNMRTNLVEVATRENQYFIIEKVIGHRWKDPQKALSRKGQIPSNLELHIKWQGYEEPEWNRYDEPSIKKVHQVIQYLKDNTLQHLIPPQLRKNVINPLELHSSNDSGNSLKLEQQSSTEYGKKENVIKNLESIN